MLYWAIVFLVITLISSIFGYGGVVSSLEPMAKQITVFFLSVSVALIISHVLLSIKEKVKSQEGRHFQNYKKRR